MRIGVPKEIKTSEYRVALTPGGALELKKCGHEVYLEAGAGLGSGFTDQEYLDAGTKIVSSPAEVYAKGEMIVKVKEPQPSEYSFIQPNQIIFTYFHFASSNELTNAMIASKAICLAYETVEKADKSLPLLIPMSEVAGRMAIQEGAKYLEKQFGGRGVLLGGVPGVLPAHVVILGAGIVGTNAARMAAGLGANVTLMDVNTHRLRYLDEILPPNIHTVYSSNANILEAIRTADLIVGAVLIPGGKAPRLISREMLRLMKPGTVLIDVAVDQGGCIETCTPTTHDNPTFTIDGIVHYCVANMPGAVPRTSTFALTNVTLPYILQVANKGWKKGCQENIELLKGLNIAVGQAVHPKVAEAFQLSFTNPDKLLI